jgi:hypothetical protein
LTQYEIVRSLLPNGRMLGLLNEMLVDEKIAAAFGSPRRFAVKVSPPAVVDHPLRLDAPSNESVSTASIGPVSGNCCAAARAPKRSSAATSKTAASSER